MYRKEFTKTFHKRTRHYYYNNNNNSPHMDDNPTKYHSSKDEHAPRKSYERKETYTNDSDVTYSLSKTHKHKYNKQEYTPVSRKYRSETNNSTHKRQSWNPEKEGEPRSERSFLDFIGIETNENIIAKRQFQIDAAKASFAYARYSMLVGKNQRITDMPQTPNKFMRTDTASWMQTVKKWVKQLRGWQLPGGPSLPSPVWIPEGKPKPDKSHKEPVREYESDSSVTSQEKYRSKKENYEKKLERKRKRSPTPSPPRTRTFTHNTQASHTKYPRTSTHDTKYPPRAYTKKIHYEPFSNSEDFANNSPKLERKVSYVKGCGPRFSLSTREEKCNSKQDLRYKMRQQTHSRNNLTDRKFEYRNESARRSYTNISWSPENSPIRQSHYSPYMGHRNVESLPRDRQTSPITPPLMHKELTPEFDIPGQQWEMENELVLLEDA